MEITEELLQGYSELTGLVPERVEEGAAWHLVQQSGQLTECGRAFTEMELPVHLGIALNVCKLCELASPKLLEEAALKLLDVVRFRGETI